MQSSLVKRLFHRKLSNDIEDCLRVTETFAEVQIEERIPSDCGQENSAELAESKAISSKSPVCCEEADNMPRTIRELLSDTNAREPRYVRLHNANYNSRELLNEILSMANRIVRRISGAQLNSADRRWWPVREVASKWDSIRAYPEMLQEVDTELLKILVLDAYADMEKLERA